MRGRLNGSTAPTVPTDASVLVGGVGELFQGDLDAGRLVVERVGALDLGPHVTVEDLHYGALAVAQLLEDLEPTGLVLVGAVARDRPGGAVTRRRVDPGLAPSADAAQNAIEQAATGYVDLDLVIEVARALSVLPPRTVAVEIEPVLTGPQEGLSAPVEDAMEEALASVRDEVGRIPLLVVGDRIRARLIEHGWAHSPAVASLEELLGALELLDVAGRWGDAFGARDRLRARISAGDVPHEMDHLDWSLWWALIEGLDRVEAEEAR